MDILSHSVYFDILVTFIEMINLKYILLLIREVD